MAKCFKNICKYHHRCHLNEDGLCVDHLAHNIHLPHHHDHHDNHVVADTHDGHGDEKQLNVMPSNEDNVKNMRHLGHPLQLSNVLGVNDNAARL